MPDSTIPRQPAFAVDEFQRRWESVRKKMRACDIDVLVTSGTHNIFYLTGMDSENLFDYQCVILSREEAPTLLILEFELARSQNSSSVEDVRAYGPFDDPIAFTGDVVRGRATGGRVAVDRSILTAARYEALVSGLEGFEVVDAFGLVEQSRLVKSPAELTYMEEAARLTDVGVEAAVSVIGEGVEDREVAAAILDSMYRAGSDTTCWGPIVAAGYRAGSAHSTFNGHRIANGETVFLELTGEVSRYTSPLMRTVAVGEPSERMQQVAGAVTTALAAIVESARPGVAASYVAFQGLAALEEVLPDHIFHHYFGYPVGIGYPPTWIENLGFFIRTDNQRPLQRGMTFHLPISIRKFGVYGINLSHTIVIEDEGARVLGRSPAQMVIL